MSRAYLFYLLLPVAFQFARADEATTTPSLKVVVVFGDSLTQGNELPAAQQDQLWLKLVEQQAQGRIRMENEGKGGRPTASLPAFEAMLLRHPHLVSWLSSLE
jgi:hypothetical protein